MSVAPLIVLDEIVYSDLKKYVWYSDSPEQQNESEELFRYLLQNKIYIEGFVTDCKLLFGDERFHKPVIDIDSLNKMESVVFGGSINCEKTHSNETIKEVYCVNPALEGKKAVIWGTGDNGKFAYEILKKAGVEVSCFINADKEGEDALFGIPIHGLEELNRIDKNVVLIEAYNKYFEMDKIIREEYPDIVQRFFCDVHSRFILYRKQGMEKVLFSLSAYDRLNLVKLHGKKVKIYGTGDDAVELSCYLRLMDFDFAGYLSDEINSIETNGDGYRIEPVEEILYEDNYAIWILCQEIERAKNRLKELGVCLDLDVVMPRKRRNILDVSMGYTYDIGGYHAGMMVYGQQRKRNYNIVVLGGSTTDGGNWNFIKSWSQFLYEKLDHRNITIYNAGVSGYASGQELIRLVRDALPLRPDMVLVYDGANDSGGDAVFPEEPYAFSYARKVYGFGARHMENEFIEQENEKNLINYGVRSNIGRFENWLSNIESMQAICAKKGIAFYSFMQPMLMSKAKYNVAERKLHEKEERRFSYMAGFRKLMKEYEIEKSYSYIYDLSHIFDEEYDVYFDACHVCEKGNEIIASEIYKRISDKILTKHVQ